jgi:hypothetical protein
MSNDQKVLEERRRGNEQMKPLLNCLLWNHYHYWISSTGGGSVCLLCEERL